VHMFALVHVLIALSSIVLSGIALFAPSLFRMRLSCGLVALTLVSGTYLVISTHAKMLQACVTGIIYLGIVTAGLAGAYYRLAKISSV
jgi:hypothetical protein